MDVSLAQVDTGMDQGGAKRHPDPLGELGHGAKKGVGPAHLLRRYIGKGHRLDAGELHGACDAIDQHDHDNDGHGGGGTQKPDGKG